MLVFKRGDIFDSRCDTLVNPVNTVGVMGAGLARQFKERFPSMFADYQERCRCGEVRVGKPYIYNNKSKRILLFPTKQHWKDNSRLEWIEEGLRYIVENYKELEIKSLAIPKLGCGLGGLRWNDVKRLIIKYLADLPIYIEVYE